MKIARPKVSVEVLKKSSNDDAALKGANFWSVCR